MPYRLVSSSYTVNPSRLVQGTPTTRHDRDQPILVSARMDIGDVESQLSTASSPGSLGITGNDTAALFEDVARTLDASHGDAMAGMSDTGREVALALEEIVIHGARQETGAPPPRTPAQAVARDAAEFIHARQLAQAGVLLTAGERAKAVIEFAMRIIRNDFEGDVGRWSANCLNTCVRTGIIVGVTATMRQLVGFFIEESLQMGDVPMRSREILAASAVLAAPVLNLAGMLRDWRNGTSTVAAQLSRLALILISVASLLATTGIAGPSADDPPNTSAVDTPSTLGSMGAVAAQMLTYTLARDIAQLFLPAASNVDSTSRDSLAHFSLSSARTTLIASTAFAGGQFAIGEAMNALAPSSGPGRVADAARAARADTGTERILDWFANSLPSDSSTSQQPAPGSDPESIRQRVHHALAALQPDFAQDLTRGALVAAGEFSDDIVVGVLARTRQVNQAKHRARQQALASGADPDAALADLPKEVTEGLRMRLQGRIPSYGQLVRQLTTTNAVRNCAIQTATAVSTCAAVALSQSSLPTATQAHLVNAVVAASVWITYLPFVYSHQQAAPDSPGQLLEPS